jgi:uncharacterized protein YdeI (YjbR/CyaY-like superfamily)
MRKLKSFKEIIPRDRAAFRRWLAKNFAQSESCWVVIFKKDVVKKNLTAVDVTEECLCYGWIDSLPSKRDAESFRLLISPRRPKSPWSLVNKKKIERLIKTKAMTVHGIRKIEAAKGDGSWSRLDLSDRLILPPELRALFAENPTAKKNFEAFTASSRRVILEWVYAARREDTKTKRITEVVELAARGLRANFNDE